jgi:hypothetical protein
MSAFKQYLLARLGPRRDRRAAASDAIATAPNRHRLNSVRQWHDKDGVLRNTTMVRQAATSDGTVVYLGVEN